MYDFIYFAHQDSFSGHFKTFKQKISLALKGYAEHAVLQFYLPPAPPISGIVVLASDKGIYRGEKKFDYVTMGMEGWRAENLSPWISDHKVTQGINLSLAILINNVHKRMEIVKERACKPKIVLLNVDKEQGDVIAQVIVDILGNIVLIGSDMHTVSAIAHKIFKTTGVVACVEKAPVAIADTVFLDVDNLKHYVGWMNFNGKFTATGEEYLYRFFFPAPLVETVLMSGEFLQLQDYQPQEISTKNILSISKIAKRYGFIPLYTEIDDKY